MLISQGPQYKNPYLKLSISWITIGKEEKGRESFKLNICSSYDLHDLDAKIIQNAFLFFLESLILTWFIFNIKSSYLR